VFRGKLAGTGLGPLEGTNVPKKNSRYVVVRDNRAGVYCGVKLKVVGKTVLKNARHIYYWKGRISTADIAARGLTDSACRVAAPVRRIELCDVVQINDCGPDARKLLEGIAPWTQ
jgi:hypothetical protein